LLLGHYVTSAEMRVARRWVYRKVPKR